MVPVECYFALSALLFFIGVYGFVTRRNLIAMLISVELVLHLDKEVYKGGSLPNLLNGGAEWEIGKFNTKTK